jgi:SSS family solute:Na+ symporter
MTTWVTGVVFGLMMAALLAMGAWALRWRPGNMDRLEDWGLGGRQFGALLLGLIVGGDIYTAYTYVAVPGYMYGSGAIGFFAVPYTVIANLIMFGVMPRLWSLYRQGGHITSADFVRSRFGSRGLALCMALTGIVATIPYIALQMYGLEICLAQMGLHPEVFLILAFALFAVYTYISGLRVSALLAVVKDGVVAVMIVVGFLYLVSSLGGLHQIFQAAAAHLPSHSVLLAAGQMPTYITLAIGSLLALFLYPHAITGILSAKDADAVERGSLLLPLFSILLLMLSLFGFAALAAGIHTGNGALFGVNYGANLAIPALLTHVFPAWFAGFAFAAIGIGALVPASFMSIAAANIFARNIYREYVRPSASSQEEATTAKLASLVVKVGALAFVLAAQDTGIIQYVINFQLLGGIWILQTLPAVLLGLYTAWFHRWAMLTGWAAGMALGTWMFFSQHPFSTSYPFSIGGQTFTIYVGLVALIVNLALAAALTPLLQWLRVPGQAPVPALTKTAVPLAGSAEE